MASTTLGCSSGKSFSSSLASSRRNDVKNSEAEEESQTIAGVREDKVKLKEPSSTPDEIVDYETYFAQLEGLSKNFNYETYLALFREFNHKEEEVENHQKEQRLTQTKRPPIRCAKCKKRPRNCRRANKSHQKLTNALFVSKLRRDRRVHRFHQSLLIL